ncbi:hypothetical protein HMPREF9144_1689 [Prevotella pallens ATCC 700821]|uniref:Uncharacterized protein n=1 Tax=Prevotella pallens ATCC 700821 TaxID=997353 RepID=F9DJ49_9BACT|nr:hypothetical protein HMPREF9144_1689 [Prevotella pallens ATCC 700821]
MFKFYFIELLIAKIVKKQSLSKLVSSFFVIVMFFLYFNE